MSGWHLADDQLASYVAGGLQLPEVLSVEAHLAGCGSCRRLLPTDREWLARSWQRIEDVLDRPALAERLLARIGVPAHLARLLLATPALSRAWLFAVVAALGFGVGAANLAGGDPRTLLSFLLVAPVLPLAGIALAYGPMVDPAHELHAATPLAGARLLLLRAGAVLTVAIVLTGIASPLLPESAGRSAAWLLPALVLTLACLIASSRLPLVVAATGLASVWALAVLASQPVDRFLLFGAAAQAGYAVAVAVLVLVLYAVRRRLDGSS